MIAPNFTLTAALGWLCLLALFSADAAASKPNVVLIVTDDQGYGDLSCHGNPVLKTPNLDRLHNESIRFTDFHVAPMCTPTRGQLMTGVDALRNGAMNVSSGRTLLRQQFSAMPEIFGAGGYRTAMFGKWHLGDNYPYRPQDRGFQQSIWYPSSHISSAADFFNNDYFDDVYQHNGVREQFKGYCTDVFFGEAMRWMREQAQRHEPFFCYLPLNAAHGPFFVPDKYRVPYRAQKPAVASFFGMIANIDENLGRLESFLRENSLRDNTILIFMTDNGTSAGEKVFNAGMRGKKIDLYEGGHRVPLFIRWPAGKLRPPEDVDTLAQCQDLLPTLIELCRLKKPSKAKFDGLSLAALLRGKSHALADRMLVSQFSRMQHPQPAKGDAVVLWNKWRLVSNSELYDIARDPSQQHDVAREFPDVLRRMQTHYENWWSKVESGINEVSRIHLGSPRETPVMLTPCDWHDVFLDQQAQIRRQTKNGSWNVFVEKNGDYRFSLRRWPIEASLGLTDAAPEYKAVDGVYASGTALPIVRANFQIAASHQSKAVVSGEKSVEFTVSLKRGPAQLRTSFLDTDGKEICGAYYVYVQPVEVKNMNSKVSKL
jgi:arylsulfatase A-like enzyme